MKIEDRIKKIISVLKKEYPTARCILNFKTPVDLLVATILAARFKDERVNMITEKLFKKYKKVSDYAEADLNRLTQDIKGVNFPRTKAERIKECCSQIKRGFSGKVPTKLEDMVKLKGIGRKSANMILGSTVGLPGIVTDTHVIRLSERLGLSKSKDPEKIEYDLNAIVPKDEWTKFSYLLIFHGRNVCKAPTPECKTCKIKSLCPYSRKSK